MREILFRAKAINRIEGREYRTHYKNGDWVFGLLSKPYHDFNGYIQSAEMRNTDGVDGIDVDYKTLGQYTGLTDKNGVKIFEGDVIKSGHAVGIVAYQTGTDDNFTAGFVVLWTRRCRYLRQELGFWATQRDITVIDNIFDNPELLGGDDHAAD